MDTFYKNGKLNVIIEIIRGKIADFKKTTSTHSPTGHSGPISTAPDNNNAFMYIETSGSNNGDGVFVVGKEHIYITFQI